MGPITTALAAFAAGLAVSFVNYRITVKAMESKKNFGLLSLRVLVSAGFIILLFLIGRKTGLDLSWLLIGGAFGLTLGLVLYSLFLGKRQFADNREKGDTDEE